MPRTTLGDARTAFWQLVVDTTSADAYLAVAVNHYMERVINGAGVESGGKWKGTILRATISIYDGRITLPRIFETCLGVSDKFAPLPIRNQWFGYTRGLITDTGDRILDDLGDGYVAFRDVAAGSKIRVTATEAGKVVRLYGTRSGQPVYDAVDHLEGIKVTTIVGNVDTTQLFDTLDRVIKDATTYPISLYMVDALAVATLISTYAPSETNPNYRAYDATNVNTTTQPTLNVICKRAYVPVVNDNDEVIPGNLGALKMGLTAIRQEDTSNHKAAMEYWGRAIAILNGELEEFLGDTSLGTVQIEEFGSPGQICNIL